MIISDQIAQEADAILMEYQREMAVIQQDIDSFNEAASAEYETLTESDLVRRFIKGVIAFFTKIAQRIKDLIRKFFGRFIKPVKSRIAATEAMGVNPEIFSSVHNALNRASGVSAQGTITCLQLMLNPTFVHPTNRAQFKIYQNPGIGKVKKAVSDCEDAFRDFYRDISNSVIHITSIYRLTLDGKLANILTSTGSLTSAEARSLSKALLPRWYTGKELTVNITGANFITAYRQLDKIEVDCNELQSGKAPGEAVAGMLREMQINVAKNARRMVNTEEDMLTMLRNAGNTIVDIHNAFIQGALASYRASSVFVLSALQSVASTDTGIVVTPVESPHVNTRNALTYNESANPLTLKSLNEGLGSVLKNMVTGDIESEIEELENEAKDIHTPEQQRYVLTKVIRLLEKLIVLRHNPSKVASFVHDNIAWFERKLNSKDEGSAGKELSTRTGENIARVSRLRDNILKKKWSDDKFNRNVEDLKNRASKIVQDAVHKEAEM